MTTGPNAFRTISEAAEEIGVPQHVLRFWETKFSFIRPMKRAGGRRFYRPQDVVVLRGVKSLLYTRGFKIEGVQRLYREQGLQHLLSVGGEDAAGFDFTVEEPADGPGEAAPASTASAALRLDRGRLRAALAAVEAARESLRTILRN